MIVDLIRHGEPVGGRRYRGATDDPLSERGWRQMAQAVGEVCPWRHIYTSPLRRCRDFARSLGGRHRIPVTEDARLRELGFGVWEGCSPEELRQQDPGQLERFYRDPVAHRPEGAEELVAFRRRVVACWEEILGRHPDEPLLVVAHAGTIRAVLSHLLGMPVGHMFRLSIAHAGMVRVRSDGERPAALHLGPA